MSTKKKNKQSEVEQMSQTEFNKDLNDLLEMLAFIDSIKEQEGEDSDEDF